MPIETKITCDACNKDLTYTGNCEDYRISVKNEHIPSRRDMAAVTLMAISPPLKGNMYFCGVSCIKKYFLEIGG